MRNTDAPVRTDKQQAFNCGLRQQAVRALSQAAGAGVMEAPALQSGIFIPTGGGNPPDTTAAKTDAYGHPFGGCNSRCRWKMMPACRRSMARTLLAGRRRRRGIALAWVVVAVNLLLVLSLAGFAWFLHARGSLQSARRLQTQHLLAQAAYALSIEAADSDGDGTIEPPAYDASGTNIPSGGGNIPATSSSPQQDTFSTRIGYCSWDNGTVSSSSNRTPGDNPATDGSVVFALISAGPDRIFQTTCANARTGTAAGDDIVAYYTVAQLRNGLAGTPYYGTPVADTATLGAVTTSGLQNGQLRLTTGADILSRWNSGTGNWNTLGGSASGNASLTGFKNYLINSSFEIWQRGSPLSWSNAAGCPRCWTADHWRIGWANTATYSMTVSQQPLGNVSGATPMAGYFMRINPTAISGTTTDLTLDQPVENVTTLAGSQAVLTFYARSSANLTVNGSLVQKFGSGGSANVRSNVASAVVTATGGWQKVAMAFTVPSIAGKTLGSDHNLDLQLVFVPTTNSTFDISMVQLEAGNTATAYEFRPTAVELGLCERYYQASMTTGNETTSNDYFPASAAIYRSQLFHLPMRIAPTVWSLAAGTTTGWATCASGAYVCRSSISANGFTYTMNGDGTTGYKTVDVRWTADAEFDN